MSDAPSSPGRSGLLEGLGKWVALLGSIVALGQAATTWINGYWADQAEQKKADQELRLTEIRERSALASEYLKLIIAKDTAPAEKVTLLDALGSIEKHPLQQWARERHGTYKDLLARSEAAFQAQRRAAAEKEGAEREEAELKAEIERLSAEAELVRDEPQKREEFRKEILEKAGLLAQVSARVSLTRLSFEGRRTDFAQVQQRISAVQAVVDSAGSAATETSPGPTPVTRPATVGIGTGTATSTGTGSQPTRGIALTADAAYGLVNTITTVTQKVSVDTLAAYFPASARSNIEVAAPFLRAALQEFQVTDKRMIAAIIATIAVETPNFETYEEPVSQAARYEGRAALGNTQPGDGERYRGRGYVGLTGRANYTAMSTRLGLGNRLVVSPEDAATPAVACRILVAWFVDREAALAPALARGDLGVVRRAVSGSATRQIEPFTRVYNQVLAAL